MIKELDDFSNGFIASKSLDSHSNTNDLLEIIQRAFKVQQLVYDYKKEKAELEYQVELSNKRIIELESQLAHLHKNHFQATEEVIADKEWNDACIGLGRVGC